jgi:group I intron endonuclease
MKNNNCGIYAIVNQVNGKMYIGSSKNLERRHYEHLKLLRRNRHGLRYRNGQLRGQLDHLQKAFSSYGEQAFKWEVLEYCKEERLKKREQYYIDKYNVFNPYCGYNLSPKTERIIMTDEIKEKIRQGNLGKKKSEEMKKKLSETKLGKPNYKLRGRKRPLEIIEKVSKSLKGRKAPNKGIPCSEEQKNKIRIKLTGTKLPEETKIKISKKLKGRLISQETRSKMSYGMRKYKHLVEEWRVLKRQGMSCRGIGKKYGVSKSVIIAYLTKHYSEKEEIMKRKYVHLVSEWRDLKNQGLNYSEIGRRYNIPNETVRHYLVNLYSEKQKEVNV